MTVASSYSSKRTLQIGAGPHIQVRAARPSLTGRSARAQVRQKARRPRLIPARLPGSRTEQRRTRSALRGGQVTVSSVAALSIPLFPRILRTVYQIVCMLEYSTLSQLSRHRGNTGVLLLRKKLFSAILSSGKEAIHEWCDPSE